MGPRDVRTLPRIVVVMAGVGVAVRCPTKKFDNPTQLLSPHYNPQLEL